MERVLWICNIMLPVIARELHLPYSNREGWLSGIFQRTQGKDTPFELGVCFPVQSMPGCLEDRGGGISRGFTVQGVKCYAFLEDLGHPEHYDNSIENALGEIFRDFKPDMIHIFGTEFPHCLAAVRAFGNPERTLIGIQGLCSEIAKVYMAGLPERVQKEVTFRDLIRKDSIRQQQEKFVLRGKNETEALRGCGNITGRTRFDRKGTEAVNPNAVYYHMNETMREEFYTGQWEKAKCEKHSIFLGQGDYPLKGMHFVLAAMNRLLPDYPDLKLYVSGNSIIEHGSLKQKLKLPAYGRYLLKLMERYQLTEKVICTGKLSAGGMKERFLLSSVFVCPSVLENSPNTVGEAMLLGVPVVASDAGGIPDMVTHERDGLLFRTGDSDALARAVSRMWDEEEDREGLTLAQRLSHQAMRHAAIAHDGENNYVRLLEIYQEILQRAGR